MGTMSGETWLILISFVLIGTTTSVLLNSRWRSYYWASTLAAGVSAIIFGFGIILLDGTHRADGEGIMIAFFAYLFFIPLTFAVGAIFKLLRKFASA